jgi:hypothetical protein
MPLHSTVISFSNSGLLANWNMRQESNNEANILSTQLKEKHTQNQVGGFLLNDTLPILLPSIVFSILSPTDLAVATVAVLAATKPFIVFLR